MEIAFIFIQVLDVNFERRYPHPSFGCYVQIGLEPSYIQSLDVLDVSLHPKFGCCPRSKIWMFVHVQIRQIWMYIFAKTTELPKFYI